MSRTRPLLSALTVTGAVLLTLMGGATSASAATAPAVVVHTQAATPSETAWIVHVDDIPRTAEIAGRGQPGAVITVDAPTGPVTTIVSASGEWTLDIGGLVEGSNAIAVSHTYDGTTTALTTVYPHIGAFAALPLYAEVDDIDTSTGTVSLSGGSRNGSTITVTTPSGEVFTTVALDRLSWSLDITDLPEGEHTLLIQEYFNGLPEETVEVTVIIGNLESPIVGGLVAAAVLASGVSTALWLRRRIA